MRDKKVDLDDGHADCWLAILWWWWSLVDRKLIARRSLQDVRVNDKTAGYPYGGALVDRKDRAKRDLLDVHVDDGHWDCWLATGW